MLFNAALWEISRLTKCQVNDSADKEQPLSVCSDESQHILSLLHQHLKIDVTYY